LALGRLGDKKAVPLLLKHLDDSDSDVRSRTALALGQLGDKKAVLFLLSILRDKQSILRVKAFSELKKLSESGQIANFPQSTAYLFLALGGGLFFVTAFVGGMGLIFFLRIRNPYPLSWSGHLLLPEEMIAELIALKRRRQKQNLPQWKLLLELTVEILLLFWAIHIQVRFQNLSLPPGKKRNID
jgi:HEAT repeats